MPVDHDIIVRVFLRDRTKMLAYIWSIVRDDDLADDIYQEVSVLALNKAATIHDEEHLLRWTRLAARYKAFNVLQRQQHAPVSLDNSVLDLIEDQWSEYDAYPSSEMITALRLCMNRLSPYASKLVSLRYGEGLSGQALANALNRKLRTVYMAVSRVHRSLADCVRQALADKEEIRG